MDADAGIDSHVEFDIQLETAQGLIKFACQGRVVRAERKGQRQGIAVALTDINMLIGASAAHG